MSFSELSIFDVSRDLKLEIMSLMNGNSPSLLGGMVSFNDWTVSSKIGMLIERGAWSEDSRNSVRMVWLFSSTDPCQRNIKSITELDSLAVSENLVEPGLVGSHYTPSSKFKTKKMEIKTKNKINQAYYFQLWQFRYYKQVSSLFCDNHIIHERM